jgi:hypothetical protein
MFARAPSEVIPRTRQTIGAKKQSSWLSSVHVN